MQHAWTLLNIKYRTLHCQGIFLCGGRKPRCAKIWQNWSQTRASRICSSPCTLLPPGWARAQCMMGFVMWCSLSPSPCSCPECRVDWSGTIPCLAELVSGCRWSNGFPPRAGQKPNARCRWSCTRWWCLSRWGKVSLTEIAVFAVDRVTPPLRVRWLSPRGRALKRQHAPL